MTQEDLTDDTTHYDHAKRQGNLFFAESELLQVLALMDLNGVPGKESGSQRKRQPPETRRRQRPPDCPFGRHPIMINYRVNPWCCRIGFARSGFSVRCQTKIFRALALENQVQRHHDRYQ